MLTELDNTYHRIKTRLDAVSAVLLIIIAITLSGCENSDSDSDSDSAVLLNSTQSNNRYGDTEYLKTELSGTYEVFERATISLYNSTADSVNLSYYVDDMQVGSQRAWVDENGDYTFLIPPLARDQALELTVYVDDIYSGVIVLLPLTALLSTHQPGEYSLTVANSIMYGLRSEVEELQVLLDHTESSIELVDTRIKLSLFANAISDFQLLVEALHDVASFNNPIRDGENIVLGPESLNLLDRLYQQLFLLISRTGLFLDTNGTTIFLDADSTPIFLDDDTDSSRIGDTAFFDGFFLRAFERYRTMDGIRALASLVSSSLGSPDEYTVQLIAASMLPAIAAHGVENSDQSTLGILQDSVELLRLEKDKISSTNTLYAQSHAALEKLVEQLQIVDATGS